MSGAPDPEIVRALSVRQPYAELILRGKKRQEYRSRRTNVRERVWLYASLTDADDARAWRQVGTPKGGLVKGKIIGSVVITGCKERDIDDFAWVLSDPRRLDVPLEVTNQPQPGIWRPKFKKVKAPARPFSPPKEAFAAVKSGRAKRSAPRAASITGELVCYHNPNTMGTEAWELVEDGRISAICARRYRGAEGKRIWLVTGRESPRRYYVAGWFRVKEVDVEDYGHGMQDYLYHGMEMDVATRESHLVEIGNEPWFKDLRRACANFATMQHVKDRRLLRHLESAWAGDHRSARRRPEHG